MGRGGGTETTIEPGTVTAVLYTKPQSFKKRLKSAHFKGTVNV